jgi:hypothetical protein
MGKTKGAAPAAPKKTRARKKAPAKKEIKVPEHLLVPVEPGEWPSNLSNEDAEKLFEFVEEGGFLKDAAAMLGVKRSTISQWKKRHKQFALRMLEAEEIGAEFLIEDMDEFAKDIYDRDSAAAAKEKRENRMEVVRAKWPQKYRTSPFKPAGNDDAVTIVGVVVIPQKSDDAGHVPQRAALEGQATVIQRLPAANPAPATFKVRSGG